MELKLDGSNIVSDANECVWNMLCSRGSMRSIPDDCIKNQHGVYVFFDWNDKPIRIGKSVKARNRIMQYERDPKFTKWSGDIQFVSVFYTSGTRESSDLELRLIQQYQPSNNVHSLLSA
jgi:excinuclease UvrABC nuclease subunit